ncbi:eukaryotic translation initiation factor 1a [Anaeramoeba flamelloides]|uniref:Eukaryotic translation initiation factor 1a n=1 Tax=Anaeramoeba flamelloides TaxID=1746091 RepID=A0AAV7YKD7_9EUKA|nr:eukaryotic translation initiation factor 1a isoform a [Anaeramoeba flamelloides]KAJ3435631.1 eukaryotic translation initiation factor 1a isoform a [Anaeramoeba flamelloides]KAJ6230402.1 eukaryotic translation initiation factor 1a [Anaeramoeba flamelloides]KAJ6243350.1 eukaryotic translation initiation factor 1a [Anaeramoeba flamelloides]|eukprot:Anaeramoba_flamelloidesa819547_71.p2 GENE.a819547_71~~a819547_71.p2  ORF type:complete len:151 (+),score=40.89 a819547_71:23-454(+)
MSNRRGKGGKKRQRGKKNFVRKRQLVEAGEGQVYAIIEKVLGDCRLKVNCFDGITREAHIRGKLRRRVWMGVGDYVLVEVREYQPTKSDVLVKYTDDEVRELKQKGEIPVKKNKGFSFQKSSGEENENEKSSSDSEEIDINKI